MKNNFINSINQKAGEFQIMVNDKSRESLLKMELRFGLEENKISDYQKAFLILLYEQLDELNPILNSEIDKYFNEHKECDGVVEDGIGLPADNSERWELLFQFTISGQQTGQLFKICYKGWEVENSFTYVES